MKRLGRKYLDAYMGLSPSAWWLSVVMLVNRMGTMVLPFMTLYMTESRGVSISKAGFVMTMFGLGAICGAFIGGKLTDKFGFYYIQLFSLFGGGVMFLVLSQVTEYNTILLVTFLLSFVNEAFRPANASAIAHFSHESNRTRSFSLNRLAINLGWAVGGSIGGFVASKSYYLLFWIDGLTNIGAAVLLWLLLAPSKNKDSARKPVPYTGSVKSAYKDKPYLVFIVLNTLFAICFFQTFTTIPLYFKQDLLMKESQIGIIMAINGLLIGILEMVIVHKLESKGGILSNIIRGVFLVALAFVALNLLPGMFALAMVFIILLTVGEMVGMPFMNTYWIDRANNSNRGQYAALFTMSWAVAQVVGPGMGALIAQYGGFTTLWWVIAGICIIAIAGYRWLQLRTKSR
jgi:predicted MFS family arabinose efflux permease